MNMSFWDTHVVEHFPHAGSDKQTPQALEPTPSAFPPRGERQELGALVEWALTRISPVRGATSEARRTATAVRMYSPCAGSDNPRF